MNALKRCLVALVAGLLATAPAAGQTPALQPPAAGVPPSIWTEIQALGPVVDPAGVNKIYATLRGAMPTGEVKRTADVSYGADPKNVLDIYEPSPHPAGPAPVLIFVHGGAFVGGSNKSYDNIGYYFARHGVLAILPDYRLAPAHPWPAGAEDVGAAVRWTKAHAAQYGGNPARVFLFGHSAGATHAGAYALEKRFQPAGGSGLAGVILGSGLYDPALEALWTAGGTLKTAEAYYGTDHGAYAERSTAFYLDAPRIPTMIFEVELDPAPMVVSSGALFTALCHRDGQCPIFDRFLQYDHISAVAAINTGDDGVSGPILDFIRSH